MDCSCTYRLLRRELTRRAAGFRRLGALLLEAAAADAVFVAKLLELTRPPVVEAIEVRLLQKVRAASARLRVIPETGLYSVTKHNAQRISCQKGSGS